jgi:hypothetical protein
MSRRIALALAAMFAVGACSAQTVVTALPAGAATQAPANQGPAIQTMAIEAPTPTAAPTPVVAPTPTGPATYQIGDAVTVTEKGANWAKITISDVKVVASYERTYPKTAGNVFIQAKVTYAALVDGIDFNPLDWTLYCAGSLVTGYTHAFNGPDPALHAGTLPNGGNVSGYVVYEVPPTGEVRMAYGDPTDVFEVIIRAS